VKNLLVVVVKFDVPTPSQSFKVGGKDDLVFKTLAQSKKNFLEMGMYHCRFHFICWIQLCLEVRFYLTNNTKL
jgi:hypothetical protein